MDPQRYYRLDSLRLWFTLACWTAAFLVYVAFGHRLARNHIKLWIGCATLIGIVMLPFWLLTLFFVTSPPPEDHIRTVQVQLTPDGRVEAVTLYGDYMMNNFCQVWLREPDGLFARRVLLLNRTRSGCPNVQFLDNTTISIDQRDGRPPLTTTFDPDRMQVAESFAPQP
ncbi:hypothetical protein ACWDOP_21615 [Nocardia sp. NPDC003693]